MAGSKQQRCGVLVVALIEDHGPGMLDQQHLEGKRTPCHDLLLTMLVPGQLCSLRLAETMLRRTVAPIG